MLQFRVELAKNFFFDREVVRKAADAATRRNLSKFGAFVRRAAKQSLRYRKESSAPGSPPSAHRTATRFRKGKDGTTKAQAVSPLREFIFFAYEPATRSVVIGPAKLNKPGNAPAALEYGGPSTIERDGKTVAINVRARPFMRPAFEQVRAELPGIWRDSVRR